LENRTADTALAGNQILIPPNSPSPGMRMAFMLDDGMPIELLEFVPDSHYLPDATDSCHVVSLQ
jgi:hypothetical protein